MANPLLNDTVADGLFARARAWWQRHPAAPIALTAAITLAIFALAFAAFSLRRENLDLRRENEALRQELEALKRWDAGLEWQDR